jgi:hypothetical protein
MGTTMKSRIQSARFTKTATFAAITLSMLLLTGCTQFDQDYSAAKNHRIYPASDPLVGAWKGTWHSTKYPAPNLPVRAAISTSAPGKYAIELAWNTIPAIPVLAAPDYEDSITITDATITKQPDGSFQFQSYDPLDIGGWGFCYQAAKMQGSATPDTLHIAFTFTDAFYTTDQGEMILHRDQPHNTNAPAPTTKSSP